VKSHEVLPQIILYSPAEAISLKQLMTRGIVPFDDVPVLYVLGRYVTGQTSTPQDLLPFLAAEQPVFSHWTTCAFGQYEAQCVLTSVLLGGHVRVGFENNRTLPDGTTAKSNADLVSAVVEPMRACGLAPISAAGLIDTWRGVLGH
jgi:uncharacterized protein (DUF849 family)